MVKSNKWLKLVKGQPSDSLELAIRGYFFKENCLQKTKQ